MAELEATLRQQLGETVRLQSQTNALLGQLVNQGNNTNIQSASAQAISPTSYAAYSQPYANPFAPSPQASARFQNAASQTGFAQATGGASLKSVVFGDASSRYSGEQVQQIGANFGASAANAAIAGGGAITSGATGFASLAFAPGLTSSLALGTAGGVGVGAVTAIMLDQANQATSYNKYLLQESYRFINPLESNNERGVAGFGRQERWQATTFLRNADLSLRVSDDDVMGFLQTFTEGGLLRDASDLESFQKKFSDLVGYVKQAAVSLNASYEETSKLMADLEKQGILSTDFNYFASASKISGSYSGLSAVEALGVASGISSSIVGGTAGSATISMQNAAFGLALFGGIYDTAKTNAANDPMASLLYNTIANAGGVENATQASLQLSQNAVSNTFLKDLLILGYEGGEDFSGTRLLENLQGLSLADAYDAAIAQGNRLGPEATTLFYQNAYRYGAELSVSQQSSLINQFLDTYYESQGGVLSPDTTTANKLRLTLGLGEAEAILLAATLDELSSNPDFESTYARQTTQQSRNDAATANSRGALSWVGDAWKSTKNWFGAAGQGIASFFTDLGTDLSEWAFGKQYVEGSASGVSYGGGVNNLIEDTLSSINALDDSDRFLVRTATSRKEGYTVTTSLSISETIKQLEKSIKKEKDEFTATQLTSALANYTELQDVYEGFSYAGGLIAEAARTGSGDHFAGKYGKFKNLSFEDARETYGSGKSYLTNLINNVRGSDEKIENFIASLQIAPSDQDAYRSLLNSGASSTEIVDSLLTYLNNGYDNTLQSAANEINNINEQANNFESSLTGYTDALIDLTDTINDNSSRLRRSTMQYGGASTPSSGVNKGTYVGISTLSPGRNG